MTRGLGGLLLLAAVAWPGPEVDPRLPRYKPAQEKLQGELKSIGSDTMNNVMILWAEGFRTFYPEVPCEIGGKGNGPNSVYPPSGVRLGPASRPLKQKEVADFEKAMGYKPTSFRTGIEMLAVFVHKENPIASLTLQQADAIFSKTRKGGLGKDLRTWGDLGLSKEWKDKPIQIHGRNSASGTYGFFKEHALFGGDYKDEIREQAGSSAVVKAVSEDRYAIGYSGASYANAGVRAVPLALDEKSEPVAATPENMNTYALARYLWIHADLNPDAPLDPVRREFLRYVFSKEGQHTVVKDGYFPVSAAIAREELKKVR